MSAGTTQKNEPQTISYARLAQGEERIAPSGSCYIALRMGVSANDSEKHVLMFSPPSQHPAGAFGVRKYVVFNTREGMTKPGQWYLDRTAGKVVYWPLPGEDMTKAKVVAPVHERIVAVIGTRRAPAAKIKLRGISQAINTPLKPAGFSAGAYDGALHIDFARECVFENLEIANVGGQAIQSRELEQCQIIASHVHQAGACGIRSSGSANLIARNHIHDIGLYHPSAVAVSIGHEMPPATSRASTYTGTRSTTRRTAASSREEEVTSSKRTSSTASCARCRMAEPSTAA
jgi:hypothetical protein